MFAYYRGGRMSALEREKPGLTALDHDHRVRRRPTRVGRAAGVHDPDVPDTRHLGNVCMAVGDHVTAGEVTDEPLVPSCGAAGVVNEPDSQSVRLDDPPPR